MGMKYEQLCEAINLRCKAEWVDENPNMTDMPRGSSHWKVTLTCKPNGKVRRLTTFFSMGPALTGEPQAKEVLDCLLSDGWIGRETFEDFCSDMGLDTDSRSAYRTWELCQLTDKRLDKFLGEARESLEGADR